MRTMSIVEVVKAMTKKKNNFQRWLEPYQECRNRVLDMVKWIAYLIFWLKIGIISNIFDVFMSVGEL